MPYFTWGILIILIVGPTLSATSAWRIEAEEPLLIAYGVLYLLVATMEATGDLREVAKMPLLITVGIVWISIQLVSWKLPFDCRKPSCFCLQPGAWAMPG